MEPVKRQKIDEKIDELIKWKEKHPDIPLSRIGSKYIDKYLDNNKDIGEEERKKLVEEYKTMQRYLEYVKHRTSEGKLKPEQLKKLKEASFDKKYGYSKEIEELSLKYRLNSEKIKYILDKYTSMDGFIIAYRDGKLDEKDIKMLGLNLKGALNIDKESTREDMLFFALVGERDVSMSSAYSSEGLNKAIGTLNPREIEIIKKRYGLEDGKPRKYNEIGADYNVTAERIKQIEIKALRKLRHPSRIKNIVLKEDEAKKYIDEVFNSKSNAMFYPDEEYKDIPCDLDYNELKGVVEARIKAEAEREKVKDNNNNDDIEKTEKIEEFDFSIRTFNCLKRAGIHTTADLIGKTEEELKKIRNLGQRGYDEVIEILSKPQYGIALKDGVIVKDDNEEKVKEDKSQEDNQDNKKTYTELEEARQAKAALEAQMRELNAKINEAKELLESYNKALGNNTKENDPDFKD